MIHFRLSVILIDDYTYGTFYVFHIYHKDLTVFGFLDPTQLLQCERQYKGTEAFT